MAQIDIQIHGKSYGIACDDGQEARVTELGGVIDAKVREIAQAGLGTRNDSHALVLTALMMADEIEDLRSQLAQGKAVGPVVSSAPQVQEKIVYQGLKAEEEELIVGAVKHLANRIDGLSQRMEDA